MSAARGEAVGGLYGLTRWPVEMQVRLWLHGRRGAPCGRLLEADDDVDAAARGVCERLFGLVAEGSVLETVKREHESGEGESASVSSAGTKGILWGGGAPQGGNLCLLEDGCERGGALVSDAVAADTAGEGQGGSGERACVSMGADRKANTWGVVAHSNEVTALPLSPSHSAMMPSVLATNFQSSS